MKQKTFPILVIPASSLIFALLMFSGCQEKTATDKAKVSPLKSPSEVNKKVVSDRPTVSDTTSIDAKKETRHQRVEEKSSKAIPQKRQLYRASDNPDRVGKKDLKKLGIMRYESKRFILYTDIDAKIARTLPPLVDQLYDSLVAYFGELQPNREGTEFRVTGFLMRDRSLYSKLNLLPREMPGTWHGRHLVNEFWMEEQKAGYYRRHLLFHEFTHCFMMIRHRVNAPGSYLEGMAELFGTHQIKETDGLKKLIKCTFRVFPDKPENFVQFGRIEMIKKDLEKGKFLSILDVQNISVYEFDKNENYAWSWAYCYFICQHPLFKKMYQEYGKTRVQTVGFESLMDKFKSPNLQKMQVEWHYFIKDLCYGYQLNPTYIDFQAGNDLKEGEEKRRIEIEANRGWQSGAVHVVSGQTYRVSAKGRFTLSNDPKPWVSEPQGVSIAYFREKPLGMLLATIVDDSLDGQDIQLEFPFIPIGNESEFQAKKTGTLYFRINDYGDSLEDNQGTIEINIKRIEAVKS